jgi:RsiW-degrading membrane proteinase PrsW (M82 family)
MNFATLELSVVAIIPAIILAAYIFINDRLEREPIPLLALLFAVGGIAYFPAYYLEKLVVGLIDKMFSGYAIGSIGGVVGYTESWAEYTHGLLAVLIGIALIEELIKWAVMFFITFKNKNFNCMYDGIVYAAFVALGFGMVENVRYAWLGGWDLLLLKTMTTLPAHLLFAIDMGYLYTMWRTHKTARSVEKDYEKKGLITVKKPFRPGLWFAAMIVLPIIQHGVYGFAGYFGTPIFNIIFYVLNTVTFIACIVGVVVLSKKDGLRGRYADMMLDKKYPETKDLCNVVDDITEEEQTNEQ